jgi:hypothetical protein
VTGPTFPLRRSDGSFVVSARFTVTDDALLPLVSDYLTAWIRANHTWIRIWRSSAIHEERLEFSTDFSSPPHLRHDGPGRLSILLVGRPGASNWKDWATFLVKDLCSVFSEITFEGFGS